MTTTTTEATTEPSLETPKPPPRGKALKNRLFSELPDIDQRRWLRNKRKGILEEYELQFINNEGLLGDLKQAYEDKITHKLEERDLKAVLLEAQRDALAEARINGLLPKIPLDNNGKPKRVAPVGTMQGTPKLGGLAPKGGRQRGQVEIYSKDSAKKLQELGFDPIVEMIRLKDEIDKDILELKAMARPPMQALAALQNTKQKIVNDLMRYGYARQTETSEVLNGELTPINISLDLG